MKEAIKRRRWLWLTTGALGLLIGAGFHLAVPSQVAALSNLYLLEPASAGSNGMGNDVSLLETNAVTEQAFKELDLPRNAPLPGPYSATPLSDIILRVKAEAPNPGEAVAWANAVVKAFFIVRNAELGSQTNLLVNVLNEQEIRLNKQVSSLNNSIHALSVGPAGANTANQIGQLVNERSNDVAQVAQLQGQAQQDLVAESTVVQGSRVIDPAVAIVTSKKKVFATDGLSGLVGGLAIGLGAVMFASAVSERPRRRSQIAGLLGAPVELSFASFPAPALRRSSLRSAMRKPGPELRMIERRLRGHLLSSSPHSLAVVSMAANAAAAVSVSTLGLRLSGEGKNVLLVDMCDGRPLAKLFGVAQKGGSPKVVMVDNRAITVLVAPADPGELSAAEIVAGADVVLIVCSLDPALGSDHLTEWTTAAVVVMTAGKVTETAIEATAQMLCQADLAPRAAILLGVGREDESYGQAEAGDLSSNGRREPFDGAGAEGNVTWPAMRLPPPPSQPVR